MWTGLCQYSCGIVQRGYFSNFCGTAGCTDLIQYNFNAVHSNDLFLLFHMLISRKMGSSLENIYWTVPVLLQYSTYEVSFLSYFQCWLLERWTVVWQISTGLFQYSCDTVNWSVFRHRICVLGSSGHFSYPVFPRKLQSSKKEMSSVTSNVDI